MSVALWKTILMLAKAGAALLIAGSALLSWGHRGEMGSAWASPDFSPPLSIIREQVAQTGQLSLTLGRFQRERPVAEAPKEEPKVVITDVLNQLCEITNAIIIPPPYEEGGFLPALVIRWKQRPAGETGETRIVRLGEALIERPDPRGRHYAPIPVKYKFVGCERDPANPRGAFFLFDMECDGTNIQKARWALDEPKKEEPIGDASAPAGPVPVNTEKAYVGPRLSGPPPEGPAAPEQVQPVAPQPPPEPVRVEQAPTGTMFDDEDGVLAPTVEGVEYLEKNYEKILEETRTESYRGRDGRTGVRIVGIADQSVANQFGIRKDDVILKINGVPVSNQSDAVNIVKNELKKKVRIIRVTIQRAGREIEKSFDTRDPATRRAAKRGFGNR